MLEASLFWDLICIYILKYCLFGFSIYGSLFEFKLIPFDREFYFRYVPRCKCCDLFMFDILIPYIIEISIKFQRK